MSLALRWDDENGGGMLFLNVVTSYSQDYSGKVSQHPIDLGGSITDHYIKNNPRFKVSAVITGVDISTSNYLIEDLDGNIPYNVEPPVNPVSVNSTDQSVLQKFIPDSIGQFLPNDAPEVVVDGARTDLLGHIRDILIKLTSGEVFDSTTGQYVPNIQVLNLFEYDGYKLTRIVSRLVMTNVTFKETPETGYALYCDFSFEQVTFVNLKQTAIPKDVQSSLLKKASAKSTKGKQDSTPQDVGSGDNSPKTDISPSRPTSQGGITSG